MVIYTGDKHGDPRLIADYVELRRRDGLPLPETIVILGDVGANYYLNGRDRKTKKKFDRIGVDLLCVHGNHEARPQTLEGYEEETYRGGKVLAEPRFPRLKFAVDGELYDLDGRRTLVIGGAYSVDKEFRLERGWAWFEDEQPSEETKALVMGRLAGLDWQVDQILSHTCPLKYAPVDTFIPGIDQSSVDTSTEEWLDEIEDKTDYGRWLCGHYHIDRDIGNFHFLFDRFME